MKILVVDDDRIARKVLRAFLEDAKYQVLTVEDGKQAIDAVLADDAPPIVILDWVMPGMTGPEVCTKLRAAQPKIRPYVLMLSAKTDKNEIVAGLDAGADDFLSKPFNLAELLARLRVAQRMVDYEIDLRKKLAELEALEQRHRLLGELLAPPAAESGETAPAPPTAPAAPDSPRPIIPPEQLASLACSALEQLGIGEVRVIEPPVDFRPFRVSYAAWVALVAIDEHRWIDLVLEGEPTAVGNFLAKTIQRRSNPNLPKQAFLAEALSIISTAVRTELRTRTCDTLMPFLSRGLYLERPRMRLPLPDDVRPLHLKIGSDHLVLCAVEQASPVRRKSSTQLRLLDVLAAAYPPPSVNEVALLNRGAILNERYIEKLTSFAEATSEQHPIPVYVPTPLATFFNREGAD